VVVVVQVTRVACALVHSHKCLIDMSKCVFFFQLYFSIVWEDRIKKLMEVDEPILWNKKPERDEDKIFKDFKLTLFN